MYNNLIFSYAWCNAVTAVLHSELPENPGELVQEKSLYNTHTDIHYPLSQLHLLCGQFALRMGGNLS